MIDIGSAFDIEDPPNQRACTPAYAAPEVLEGKDCTVRSDLASLGYVTIELLSGRPPFAGISEYQPLLKAKYDLPAKLYEIMPEEVACNDLLMGFCLGLIEPDPALRFPSAEDAELLEDIGAAAFHRQLIKNDMASEYENDIRIWVEELLELQLDEELDESGS